MTGKPETANLPKERGAANHLLMFREIVAGWSLLGFLKITTPYRVQRVYGTG